MKNLIKEEIEALQRDLNFIELSDDAGGNKEDMKNVITEMIGHLKNALIKLNNNN